MNTDYQSSILFSYRQAIEACYICPTMKQQTDQELWNAIQADDELAFRTLFDRHYKSLCYTAYKVFSDEHQAKDIAQEVFLNLWRRRAAINIHTSVAAFLRRAVVNKSIDHVRAKKIDFEDCTIPDKASNIEQQQLELKELKSLIHHTVNQLPERCRLIFSLSRFEELSHKEIASQLNISEKTVENQITKALKLLRKVVASYQNPKLRAILILLLGLVGD